jgi:hypothetical protein
MQKEILEDRMQGARVHSNTIQSKSKPRVGCNARVNGTVSAQTDTDCRARTGCAGRGIRPSKRLAVPRIGIRMYMQAAANTASVRQKEILTFTLPSEAGCLRAEVSTPVTGV